MKTTAVTVKLDKQDARLVQIVTKIKRHPSLSETFRVALRAYAAQEGVK